jgi:hypothetical protein
LAEAIDFAVSCGLVRSAAMAYEKHVNVVARVCRCDRRPTRLGMNRRELITLLAGAGITIPARARAQQVRKIPVVGFLHPGFPESGNPTLDNLREGLRNEGYFEGENIRGAWPGDAGDVARQRRRGDRIENERNASLANHIQKIFDGS